jgi:hypothetical protein
MSPRVQIPSLNSYVDFPEGMAPEAMQQAIEANWDSLTQGSLSKSHGAVIAQPTQAEELRAAGELMGVALEIPAAPVVPEKVPAAVREFPTKVTGLINIYSRGQTPIEQATEPIPVAKVEGESIQTAPETSIWKDFKSWFHTPDVSPEKAAIVTGIAKKTGKTPREVLRNYEAETGQVIERGIPTPKAVAEAGMQAGVVAGLATHPAATAVALGTFLGMDELVNYGVSKLQDKTYEFQGGKGIADYLEAEGLSRDAIGLAQFAAEAVLTGGLLKGGRAAAKLGYERFSEIAKGITDKTQKVDFINDVAKEVKDTGASPDEVAMVKTEGTLKPARTMKIYEVKAEDFAEGIQEARILRHEDGAVTVFGGKGIMEYNADFAKDKTDQELLKYSFEPMGFQSAQEKLPPSTQAFSEGKPVTPEVLEEYPGLEALTTTGEGRPEKQIKPKSFQTYVREAGGIDPELWKGAGYSMEDLPLGLRKKGGRAPDELVTEMQGRGILTETPEGVSPADHFAEQVRLFKAKKAVTIDQLDKYADNALLEWEKKHGTEETIARRRELEKSIDEEIAGKTPEERLQFAEESGFLTEEISPEDLAALSPKEQELFNTQGMFNLAAQEAKRGKFVAPEVKPERLFDTEKATVDELYERKKRPSGMADMGGYARGEESPSIVEMPELVEIAKGLGKGLYPSIKKILSVKKALGLFRPQGRGKIELEAGAFKDQETAAKTLAHEIGHWVDYLPEETMARGNILGRIASLKKYTEKLLPEKPGAEGILTDADRVRFREEAKQQLKAERPDHDIVEEITREVPIYEQVGITKDMIMGIMQGRTEREKYPDLYKWLAQQTADVKKEIVKKAIKDIIDERLSQFGARVQVGVETITERITRLRNTKPPTKSEIEERLAKLWKDEIKRRKLYEEEIIISELKDLAQQWKPFDESMDKGFTAYRYSSKELYADAISVLMNNPEKLKTIAPTFHKAFFNYMENKPEVMDIYNTILERQRDMRTVLETRDQNIEAMFDKGETARLEAAREQNRFSLRDAVDALNREMNDVNYKVIQKVNALEKRGITMPPEDNPKYWVEELPYVASEVSAYIRSINNDILKPAKTDGITQRDISKYLYFRRVLTERSEMANPLGHTPKTATDALAMMKGQLGAEGYAKVEQYAKRFWEIRQDVVKKLEESGMLSDELMAKIKDNENYVTFDVQKFMDNTYGKGATGRIYKQIGTLNEINDPLTATVMKDAALFRAAHRNVTADKISTMMRDYFPDEFAVADKKFNGKALVPTGPKDPRMGLVTYMKKGKVEGFYVPKDMAETLDRDPYQAGVLINLVQAISRPLKEIFVSKNPFWMLWNIQRDIRAMATNLPEASLLKALKYEAKAIPDAYRDVFKNISTADVEQMYRNRELIVGRTYGGKQLTADAELDRLLMSFGEKPVEYKHKVVDVLAKLWDALDKPGQFSERLTKIAGHKLLAEAGTRDPKELADVVRTRVGSPDFKRAGHLVQLYNNIWLFSNAGKEGMKASWQSYQEDKAAFMWKMMKYDVMPKVAQYAAGLGLFGVGVKKLMDNIPDHDKKNYLTIPLGSTENGKTVYMVIPQDFSGQTVTGMLWSMANAGKNKDMGQLFDYMSGQIPYSGLNPLLGVIMDVAQYLSGKNPYDSFRGKPAIPDQKFEAGGKWAARAMAKYVANQLGSASILYRFNNDGLDKVKGELEEAIGIPVVGRAIERFIRVSNGGTVEQLKEIAQEVRKVRAGENLTVQDKIIDHINETKTPSIKDAVGLYELLVKSGTIKRMDRSTFEQHYKDLLIFRYNSPYATAIATARSKEEKIAIVQKAIQNKAFTQGGN